MPPKKTPPATKTAPAANAPAAAATAAAAPPAEDLDQDPTAQASGAEQPDTKIAEFLTFLTHVAMTTALPVEFLDEHKLVHAKNMNFPLKASKTGLKAVSFLAPDVKKGVVHFFDTFVEQITGHAGETDILAAAAAASEDDANIAALVLQAHVGLQSADDEGTKYFGDRQLQMPSLTVGKLESVLSQTLPDAAGDAITALSSQIVSFVCFLATELANKRKHRSTTFTVEEFHEALRFVALETTSFVPEGDVVVDSGGVESIVDLIHNFIDEKIIARKAALQEKRQQEALATVAAMNMTDAERNAAFKTALQFKEQQKAAKKKGPAARASAVH